MKNKHNTINMMSLFKKITVFINLIGKYYVILTAYNSKTWPTFKPTAKSFCFPIVLGHGYINDRTLPRINSEPVFVEEVEGVDFITWCTISEPEQEKCMFLSTNITKDRELFGKEFINLRCKQVWTYG